METQQAKVTLAVTALATSAMVFVTLSSVGVAIVAITENARAASPAPTWPLATVSAAVDPIEPGPRPKVQLALLLDTSNSMDGLIDQAKAQLWRVVNEFVLAKQDGKRPEFQVALLQYGNNSLSEESGYIQQVLPFTDDLDRVSEMLFALTTNGGQEYCGAVIDRAVKNLTWSANPNDLKVVYIAGNEAFSQGTVDYREACKQAITHGVAVNTIFCGPLAEGISTHWKDGALLADGAYMNIDQNIEVAYIPAPQDDEIERLGRTLNDTYIPYGAAGALGLTNQSAQDSNAAHLSREANIQRQVTKSNALYSNSKWDLVDAVGNGAIELGSVRGEELPAEMKGMDSKEIQEHIRKKAQERKEIQDQINELSRQRQAYVALKLKEEAPESAQTLGDAITKTVRTQAEAKKFTFD